MIYPKEFHIYTSIEKGQPHVFLIKGEGLVWGGRREGAIYVGKEKKLRVYMLADIRCCEICVMSVVYCILHRGSESLYVA